MKSKIFKSIFWLCFAVFIICTASVTYIVNDIYEKEISSFLKNEADYIEAIIDITGNTEIIEPENINYRITVISPDGTVLFDTDANPEDMELHSDREEFLGALENGSAESHRYSSTLSSKTLYYAIRMQNGNVLRLSKTGVSIFSLILDILPFLMISILISTIISLLIAHRISKSIVEPLNNIDFDMPDTAAVYPELRPFTERIKSQNEKISTQFERLQKEHKNQDKMRREFTANVSHELKTPLTSIMGYAEIIRDGIAKPDDIPRFSGKIYDESKRLTNLVGDIINLSRLDDETAILEEDNEVNIANICESTVEVLSEVAQKNGITISLECEPLTVFGNQKILSEMIYNLCDNAIKYNKQYGKVTLSVYKENGSTCISVEDTGIGIAENETDRIFERFYRIDKSRSKEVGGTGLGLSIVKHGAIYHNAEILVKSEIGKGTKITLIFP